MFFTGAVAPDGVNWDAYTHEELYRMVWDDADVGEVGAIAEEWRRHSAELADQAERLREQQAALGEHWEGESAELAAARLGELADRIDGISARAADNQRAAQQAGEALALARATLPPPPGVPAAPRPSAPQEPAGGFFLVFGAPPTSGTGMAPAFDSVASSGTGLYFEDLAASQAKAQAVQAMRVYESSLRGGETLVSASGDIGGRTYGVAGSAPTPPGAATTGSVPWTALARPTGERAMIGGDPRHGDPRHGEQRLGERRDGEQRPGAGRAPLGAGARLTVGQPAPVTAAAVPAEASARASGAAGGMAPRGQRAQGADEETHENRMPVLDHGLFTVDVRISAPVIGDDL